MATRRILTSIATALAEDAALKIPPNSQRSPAQDTQPQDIPNLLSDTSLPLLMTLHALLPDLVLPALDLLDKGLVTRVFHDPTAADPLSPESDVDDGSESDDSDGGAPLSPRARIPFDDEPSSSPLSPLAAISPSPPSDYSPTPGNHSRREGWLSPRPGLERDTSPGMPSQSVPADSPSNSAPEPVTSAPKPGQGMPLGPPACWVVYDEGDEDYEEGDMVRLEAWNCTCVEFAMDAFGSGRMGGGGWMTGMESFERMLGVSDDDEAGAGGLEGGLEDGEGDEGGDDDEGEGEDVEGVAEDVVRKVVEGVVKDVRDETVVEEVVQEVVNTVVMGGDLEPLIQKMAEAVLREMAGESDEEEEVNEEVDLEPEASDEWSDCEEGMTGDEIPEEEGAGWTLSQEEDSQEKLGKEVEPGVEEDGLKKHNLGDNGLKGNGPGDQGLSFGGLSEEAEGEDDSVPCCKHLLACFLAAKCSRGLLGSYVDDWTLGTYELAGLVAGS
jgi:hypothetical protein